MAKNKGKKQKNIETVAESLYHFFRYLIDFLICIYMLLILVVMPFYNEEGYSHIGTDKSTFFRNCTVQGSKFIIPTLIMWAIMWLVVYVQKNGWPKGNLPFENIKMYCKEHCSITDWFALGYGISVIFAYLCSEYKEEALWGTDGWYMGLIPQLTAVTVYFLVSRAWKERKWIVATVLPVSAVVFVLGYLNRFGIYPIDMKVELPSFISTIGNINWYCGYLVSVFFGGMLLLWQMDWKKTWQQFLLMAYVVIGFATLATQGSNSGILTMVVMFLLFFAMSAFDGKRMEMFWIEMLLFSVTCLITYALRATDILVVTYPDTMIDLFTNSILSVIMTCVSVAFLLWTHFSNQKGCYPEKAFTLLSKGVGGIFLIALVAYALVLIINTLSGGAISNRLPASLEAVLTFSPTWGSNRGATWTAGWLCFKEQDFLHKLFGAGPDCMAVFLYTDGSAELVSMVKECFGNARLTNAHNEWLTVLVNTGLLGLVSFVGMIVTAIKRFMSQRKINVIAGVCGVCVLAYTVNNMFSFQQSMSLATIFVILGVGENYMRKSITQK